VGAESIDLTEERQRHAPFVGRAALLARLDQLLIEDRADRWIVVTGGPGMGKSALLAAWLLRREAAGDAVPHHFIRRGQYNWGDPAALVGSLVAQIEARFPDQHESDADARMHPAARLAATLRRVSERELVPRGERLILLIDGKSFTARLVAARVHGRTWREITVPSIMAARSPGDSPRMNARHLEAEGWARITRPRSLVALEPTRPFRVLPRSLI
jgi:hypothetical protein